jgi:hypothetical protein
VLVAQKMSVFQEPVAGDNFVAAARGTEDGCIVSNTHEQAICSFAASLRGGSNAIQDCIFCTAGLAWAELY